MTRLILLITICFMTSCQIQEQKEVQQANDQSTADTSDYWQEWKLYTKDGCEVFVREMGEGPTIVFLHGGWGAEHSYMIDGFKDLSKSYHLVFYDQRGSLRSPCQTDSVITVQNHVEDLEEIRKELKEDKLMIIAHSMGTLLAMNYIDQYPDRVKGLILIAAVPAVGNINKFMDDEKTVLARWDRPEVIQTLKDNGLEKEIQKDYTSKQLGLWHSITFAAINLHDVRLWKKMKGNFYYSQKAGMAAAQSMAEEWDFASKLDSLGIPIYVIHGDDDFIPLEQHQKWTANTKNVELKIIKNAGHNIWIDQPELMKNTIDEYLNKLKE